MQYLFLITASICHKGQAIMKKILLLLIYLSFILTFNAFATEPVTDNRGAPSSSQDMPMRERGQGRMGMPPRGENGQFPQPPEGWDGQPSEGFNGQRPQMPQGSNMPFEDMNGQKPLGDTSDSQEASQQQVGGNSEFAFLAALTICWASCSAANSC